MWVVQYLPLRIAEEYWVLAQERALTAIVVPCLQVREVYLRIRVLLGNELLLLAEATARLLIDARRTVRIVVEHLNDAATGIRNYVRAVEVVRQEVTRCRRVRRAACASSSSATRRHLRFEHRERGSEPGGH